MAHNFKEKEGILKGVIWNIAGGRKIQDCWDFLKDFDLIVLFETWIEADKENDFINQLDPEFSWNVKSAIRIKKSGRAKGGQLIGVRKSVSNDIKIVEWEYGLRISGNFIGSQGVSKEIITVYINEGVGKVCNKLQEIVDDLRAQKEGAIIVGDWNARIGEDQGVEEFVKNTNSQVQRRFERNSEDKKINSEGKKFLKFCEEVGLVILNGRVKGDECGR